MVMLKDLRDQIVTKSGWQSMTVLGVLQPFFDIVQSEDTTGPITGVALQSIQNFLEHPWLTCEMDGAKIVMKEVVKAVKMCQFEVTDATTDEAILIKVLQLFSTCVQCDCGVLLEEQSVLDIMKSCFRIGRETRPTELLRRSAESILQEISVTTFRRIRDGQWPEMPNIFSFICAMCDPEDDGKSISLRLLGLVLTNSILDIMGSSITQHAKLIALVQDKLCRSLLRNSVTSNVVVLSQTLRAMHTLMTCAAPYIHEQIEAFIFSTHLRIADDKQSSSLENQELVLESLVELCCDTSFTAYLYEHFDCHDYSADIFEQICKFLAKNIKESESINTLHILSLQGLLGIIQGISERCSGSNMLTNDDITEQSPILTPRRHHIEIENSITIATVNSSISNDSNRNRGARDSSGSSNADKDDDDDAYAGETESALLDKVDTLRQRKIVKKRMVMAAAKFNQNSKEGLAMLMQPGVFNDNAATPKDIAHFLRTYNNWLSKHSIGEVIMKNSPFHEQILTEYLNSFEFKGIGIDEALRFVLHTFKLVGEAQQVEQVMKHFAFAYYDANTDDTFLENRDASWVYSVAVLMLHTDLHNHQNRNKMTLDQWIDNVRHMDDTKTIPIDELERVYAAILTKEFQLASSFSEAHKSDPAWEEMLRNSQSYVEKKHHQSQALIPSPQHDDLIDHVMQKTELDNDMFQCMWNDVIIATSTIIENTTDEIVKQNCIRGFQDCARIAAHYKHSNVFDTLIISLCNFTKVLHPQHEDSVVQFGQKDTAQLAAKIVFQMTRKYSDNLREGWRSILDLMLRMYELDLLPENLLERESFLSDVCSKKPTKKKQQGSSGGSGALYLFGFFSSSDVSLANKEYIERAEKCVEQCRIADMLNDVKFLHKLSLEYLVKALIFGSSSSNSSSSSSSSSISNRSRSGSSSNNSNNSSNIGNSGSINGIRSHNDNDRDDRMTREMGSWMSVYTRMFCLDMLTDITISNKDRILVMWDYVYEHLRNTIKDVCFEASSSRNSGSKLTMNQIITLERAIVCAMRLYMRLMYREDMINNIVQIFELLDIIPENILGAVLRQICAALLLLVKSGQTFESPRVWEISIRLLRTGIANQVPSAVEAMLTMAKAGTFVWPDAVATVTQTLLMIHDTDVVEILHSLHIRMLAWRERHCDGDNRQKVEEKWYTAWMTVMTGLAQLCSNLDESMRNTASATLQSIFLDNTLKNSRPPIPVDYLVALLTQVIIKVLDSLITEERLIHHQSRSDLEESRFRSVQTLAKSFLSYLPYLTKLDREEFGHLWIAIMSTMRRYAMDSNNEVDAHGGNNVLMEAIPEFVKNLILVMNSQDQTRELLDYLWPETEQELQRFYPQLIQEFQQQRQQQQQDSDGNANEDQRKTSYPVPSPQD